jgi:hypothetical protein
MLNLPISAVLLTAVSLGAVPLGAVALRPAGSAYAADPTGTPPATGSPDPVGSQPTPPGESATPPPTDSPPPSTASPTPQPPTRAPTAVASGPGVHRPVLRVTAHAGNAVLGTGYWRGARSTSFTVTVRNTGTVAAAVRVGYSVPAGVSDAATGACGHGSCSVSSVAPGAAVALPVALMVSPDAWRQAPLTGDFTVSARAPRARTATAAGTWGVVFPPGPPVPGIGLKVDNVSLGNGSDATGRLRIGLANTSTVPAAARLDVVVPDGVATGPLPPDCAKQPAPASAAVRCGLGSVRPGGEASVSVPLKVVAARAGTPLTGLVRATLTAATGQARTAQASYQILVPASLSSVTASSAITPGAIASDAAPAALDGAAERGRSALLDAHSAVAWPVIVASSAVLVMVIVGLVLGLRRPVTRRVPRAGRAGAAAPEPAAVGPAAPGQAVRGPAVRGPAAVRPPVLGPPALRPAVLKPAVLGRAVLGRAALGRAALGRAVLGSQSAGRLYGSRVRLDWLDAPGFAVPAGELVGGVPTAGRRPEPADDPSEVAVGDRPGATDNPPEVELAEVAAELAEVAAILAGTAPTETGSAPTGTGSGRTGTGSGRTGSGSGRTGTGSGPTGTGSAGRPRGR